MASTRRLAIVHAERGFICLNCQLRTLPSTSSNRIHPSLYATSTLRIALPLFQSQHYATNNDPPRLTARRETWTERLGKKLWENGEGPDPRSFVVPGESIEEREERIRGDEEEKAAKQKEEKDFEELRQAGVNERLERLYKGPKAMEIRGGFTTVNDQEEVIEGDYTERVIHIEQYRPATRWRGLRHIPEWEVAQKEPKPLFAGFLAREKLDNLVSIERAVQRALVEVWVLKQSGVPVTSRTSRGDPTDDFQDRLAASAIFEKAIDGEGYNLRFTDGALLGDVEQSFRLEASDEVEIEKLDRVDEDMIRGYTDEGRAPPQVASPAVTKMNENTEEPETDPSEDQLASQDTSPPHQSYRAVSLTDPTLKFEVIKRAMQLTGKRVADPAVPLLKSAGDLVRHLVKPAPVKRLVDDIAMRSIVKLSNVEVRSKRYTKMDREMEIGRWKLIETELVKRGLPLDRLKRSDGGRASKVSFKDLIITRPKIDKITTAKKS